MEIINFGLFIGFAYLMSFLNSYQIMLIFGFLAIAIESYSEYCKKNDMIPSQSFKYINDYFFGNKNSIKISISNQNEEISTTKQNQIWNNTIQIITDKIIVINKIFVSGRDKIIYYLGDQMLKVFFPKDVNNMVETNKNLMKLNNNFLQNLPPLPTPIHTKIPIESLPNTDKLRIDDPIFDVKENKKQIVANKVFKNDNDMYNFLDKLKTN